MPAKAPAKSKTEPKSLGYEAIESLLERPTIDFSPMIGRYNKLLDMAKKSKSASEKGAAKKASAAYEQFFDLMKYLLDVKAKIGKSKAKSKK